MISELAILLNGSKVSMTDGELQSCTFGLAFGVFCNCWRSVMTVGDTIGT